MSPRPLPSELGLLVIDHLGSERSYLAGHFGIDFNTGHAEALRHCALVCKDWLHRSRQNLYSIISVGTGRAWWAARATLEKYPELRAAVRVLRVWYTRGLPLWDVVLVMRTMLAPHLCTFNLYSYEHRISLDNATRLCLQRRFHTVSSLTLRNMQAGQAVYILRAFPALRHLQCIQIDISDTKQSTIISQHIPRIIPSPQLTELKVYRYLKCGCMRWD